MKNNNQPNGRLLGDPSVTVVTLEDGTKIEVPIDSVSGDLFTGDTDDYEDASLLGEPDITYLGDLLSGDPKGRSKKSSFGSAIRRSKTDANLPASQKQANGQTKQMASLLRSIPGAILSAKSVSPLMPSHGLLNITPTRAMIQGASLVETFRRYETQYAGTTRTQVNVAASGNVSFTFAAPTGAEGGNTLFVPAVLVQLGMQRQFSVPGAEIRISLTGVDESGVAVDPRQWSVLLPDSLNSMFLAFIPFREISSTVYPSIAQANISGGATTNLVVNLFALPTNTNTRVVLPGPDSTQFQYVKQLLGISPQTDTIINTVQQ